jgi:hypothetical protein
MSTEIENEVIQRIKSSGCYALQLDETTDVAGLAVLLVIVRYINKHRGPGFDSRSLLRIFLRELGLERGPLSLVIG